MSVINQFILFAEHNRLMNERLYSAARQLSEKELNKNCHAFFKTVLGTLNHIMAGDIIWLKRFANHPSSKEVLSYITEINNPKSLDSILFEDLNTLQQKREKIDEVIFQWIGVLTVNDISECISYKNMAGASFKKMYSSLISHLFLHQVHHRGQVTTLLSQFWIDFGETDIIEITSECSA